MARRVLLVVLLAAACRLDLTGAACDSSETCPTGQYCSTRHQCVLPESGEPALEAVLDGGVDGGARDGGSGFDGGTLCDGGSNTAADPVNCGLCGRTCATPVNAAAACRNGVCGRGPCRTGFFDVDGVATFGCESTCLGRVCTGPGGTTTVSNDPMPETGLTWQSVANGAAFAARAQTGSLHVNLAIVGDVTVAVDGGVVSTSPTYRHVSGAGSHAR